MSSPIYVTDVQGQWHPIHASSLSYRPAVYGILIENSQVLLQTHPVTGLLHPLGGWLMPAQTPEQALRQAVYLYAGIIPSVGPLIFVEEQYHLESGQAYQVTALYYSISRPTASYAGIIDLEKPTQPQWFSLITLRCEQLQFGWNALQMGWQNIKQPVFSQ